MRIRAGGRFGMATRRLVGLGLSLVLVGLAHSQSLPNRVPSPPARTPAQATAVAPAPVVARRSCGTHWTGWHPPAEARTNPCPAGCEPGDRLQEKRHGSGPSLVVDAQFQCHFALAGSDAAKQARPVGNAQPPREAVGTLTPDRGRWNSFVEVRGPGFARAERVAVVWYPNDDDAQPPSGSSSATVGTRTGADAIQIEVPSGAGGAVGAVLRVLVFMPGQLQPLLAGRFTVATTAVVAAEAKSADTKPRPWSVTTPPIQMTGRFVEQLGSQTHLHAGPDAFAVTTPAIQMTGAWLSSHSGRARGDGTPVPFAVTTPTLQMTGAWMAPLSTAATGAPKPVPFTVTTPAIQMTGVLAPTPGEKTRLQEFVPASAARPPR